MLFVDGSFRFATISVVDLLYWSKELFSCGENDDGDDRLLRSLNASL